MIKGVMLAAALGLSSPPSVEDLVAGRADPLRHDFGVFVGEGNAAAKAAADRAILLAHGKPADDDLSKTDLAGCMTMAQARTYSSLKAAGRLTRAEDWKEARRQADDALARRESMRRALWSGAPAPLADYLGVASRLKQARTATDPMIAQLFGLAAADNFARMGIGFFARRTLAAGLSPAALDLVDAEATIEMCRADRASHDWLERRLAQGGWVRISRDGQAAADAAWLLAQHADRRRDLQKAVLARMEPLLATGDVDGSDYAYLYDRVAVSEGRPQRYGSQGSCHGPGDWRPDPVENPEIVDRLRAEVELPPLAEYAAGGGALCR